MSFEKDFLAGYEKHSKHFDGWCEKASSILGDVTQCGIIEVDSSGHGLIVANRADFAEEYLANEAYLLDSHLTYSAELGGNTIKSFHTRKEYETLHSGKDSMFGKKFDLHCGFSYQEKIDENINRIYWFASKSPEIYDALASNANYIKKLIECFGNDSKDIIDYFRENKFNLLDKKENYFVKTKKICPREKLNNFLHSMGILNKEVKIHKQEYRCLDLSLKGKSAQQTGEILGISRRTVESHISRLQKKFKVNCKQGHCCSIVK